MGTGIKNFFQRVKTCLFKFSDTTDSQSFDTDGGQNGFKGNIQTLFKGVFNKLDFGGIKYLSFF